jgi:hypothetical protein
VPQVPGAAHLAFAQLSYHASSASGGGKNARTNNLQ